MTAAFDTYTAAKRLRDAGFDEAQAEAAVAMVREAVTEGFTTARAEATRQAAAETTALQAGFAQLEGVIEGHFSRLDARIDGLEGKIEGLEGRIEGLEGKIGSLEGRIDGLEGRIGSLEGKIEGLEGKIGSLEGRIEGIEGKVEGLERKTEKLDAGIENLAARIDNCATRGELYKALWAQGCALIVALTGLGGLAALIVGLLL